MFFIIIGKFPLTLNVVLSINMYYVRHPMLLFVHTFVELFGILGKCLVLV